ncbi:lipoyl(octanoyl) transferase [Clonorchis sinensis]|uniref:lipoyl(octanoyl) transferase n=2 Tax=Clonorchis sinensis TaxID=79923 RepID=G7YAD7_CLOSI|nr:lipoyl(octanoyl) transferase [Clonorchis sinensis]
MLEHLEEILEDDSACVNFAMVSSVTCFHVGRVGYEAAWQLQKSIVRVLKSANNNVFPHTILLLEHNPVYTIGVRSKDPENDYSEVGIARLKRLGADFVKTDRGGLITYHGPGQLVAYPIMNLRCRTLIGSGLRWYVGALEQAGVALCNNYFELQAGPGGRGDIGVWLSPSKKVMAVGVHQSESITYHGIAINCTNEPLPWLRAVVPCGLVGRDVTSLSEACNREIPVDTVVPLLEKCLINSLFGPYSVRNKNLCISYNHEFVNDWTDSARGRSTSIRLWSEVADLIIAEVQSRTDR